MSALKLTHGGRCTICGYDKCQAALHFHHRGDKVETISRLAMSRGKKAMTEEADKCLLVCSNCHFIIHSSKY